MLAIEERSSLFFSNRASMTRKKVFLYLFLARVSKKALGRALQILYISLSLSICQNNQACF